MSPLGVLRANLTRCCKVYFLKMRVPFRKIGDSFQNIPRAIRKFATRAKGIFDARARANTQKMIPSKLNRREINNRTRNLIYLPRKSFNISSSGAEDCRIKEIIRVTSSQSSFFNVRPDVRKAGKNWQRARLNEIHVVLYRGQDYFRSASERDEEESKHKGLTRDEGRDAICPNYTALITANYRPFSVVFTGVANRDATPIKPVAFLHFANLDLVLNSILGGKEFTLTDY